jgi:hypothetical protein
MKKLIAILFLVISSITFGQYSPYYTKTQVDAKVDGLNPRIDLIENEIIETNKRVYNLELEVDGIADGTGGKGYPDIATAMAVTPLPSNGTLFTIDNSNKSERGIYRYDSSELGGYAFVRSFDATGKVEEGNTQAVSGDEVFNETLTKKVYLKNINIYNYNKDILGKYISTTTGGLVTTSDDDNSVSEEIYISGFEKIIITGRTGSTNYRFLDELGNPMKALNEDGIEFANFSGAKNGVPLYVPPGAVRFQITTLFIGTGSQEDIWINDSGIKDVYFDKEITGVKKLEEINEEILEITSKNKFTGEIIEGYYIGPNGNIPSSENSSVSELIPIKPNTYYYLQRNPAGSRSLISYDSNKTTKRKVKAVNGDEYTNYYLPNLTATNHEYSGPFKTPETAAFLQISLRFNNTTVSNYDEVMLEEIGEEYDPDFIPSPYLPYNPKYIIKETALPDINQKINKQIRVLVIGNSFSQNSFCLVPKILSEIDPDLDFVIGIAYDGGSPLAQHLANFTNETQYIGETSYSPANYTLFKNFNNGGWTTSTKNYEQVLLDENWDIITFQQSGGQSDLDYEVYYKPFINKLHKIIYDKLDRNVKLGWVSIHGSYSNNSSALLAKWEGTTENSKKIMERTATSVLFPYGTAIQNARTSSLSDIGEGSAKNLMYDNAHLQSGIGELTACYTNALVIINEVYKEKSSLVGNKIDVLFDDSIIKYDVLGMTENNRFLAQASAINAVKNPYELTDISEIEETME